MYNVLKIWKKDENWAWSLIFDNFNLGPGSAKGQGIIWSEVSGVGEVLWWIWVRVSQEKSFKLEI